MTNLWTSVPRQKRAIEENIEEVEKRLDEIREAYDDPDTPYDVLEETRLTYQLQLLKAELAYLSVVGHLQLLQRKRQYSPNRKYNEKWFLFFQKVADRANQKQAFASTLVRFRLTENDFEFDTFCRQYRRWNRTRMKSRRANSLVAGLNGT